MKIEIEKKIKKDDLSSIIIPSNYNYIAVFLTFACPLRCSYCINYYEKGNFKKGQLNGKEWVKALNRIISRTDLPITLQGGEPTMHPDFFYIVNNIKADLNIDLLTNLQLDVEELVKNIPTNRIRRNSPYASIRVSYHPETMDLNETIEKVLKLLGKGYSVGIWGVLYPAQKAEILRAQKICQAKGIDFRMKEFLGFYDNKLYGEYKYPEAIKMNNKKRVLCKTTELIIGPIGDVYRCHSDVYENRMPIGNILDPDFKINDIYRECNVFGYCNPCDIKIKTNRFQQFGHTSVDIKKIEKT